MSRVIELYESAKKASDALAWAAENPANISDREFTTREVAADITRKELSGALERFHGVTLEQLQSI